MVLTNGLTSLPFHLLRGTRQGCPLSPLLFTLAIEPLAMAIRKDPILEGIKVGGVEHRIALYADDIILFCSNLKHTLPTLLELIKSFGSFAGYKINDTKSAIMFMNENEAQNPPIHCPFLISPKGFTYLGIKISTSIDKIIPDNYNPIVNKVTQLVNRWTKLPMSMIGRVNVLKIISFSINPTCTTIILFFFTTKAVF